MNSIPVTITSIVRRMRGRSQAHLVQGDDGHFYVAKFAGNPQGTRTMVNELISQQLLAGLGICTPSFRLLHLPPSLLSEKLYFHVEAQRIPPQGALHLGSQCPVDPETTVMFDFLPFSFYSKVVNLSDFAVMLVFDTWVCRTEPRQAIFVRQHSLLNKQTFIAHFIGHSTSFGGSEWRLGEEEIYGCYFRRGIYALLDDVESLVDKALCLLEAITENDLLTTVDGVPSAWLALGDRESLAILFAELYRRKTKVRSIFARSTDLSHRHVSRC